MTRITGATSEQIESAKSAINDGAPIPMTMKSEATVEMIAMYLVPPTHCIVLRDDLRALRDGLVAFRGAFVANVINNRIERLDGDVTTEIIDQWEKEESQRWNDVFPHRAAAIDRITALLE